MRRIVPLLLLAASHLQAQEHRGNLFNDPFEQATAGYPNCPRPEGPVVSESELRLESHARIERGTTCWLQGQCEDANAYKRDPEINAAVVAALRADQRFATSSVWVITQRKFVFLQGCVRSNAQRKQIVAAAQRAPRVDRVFDELQVGASSRTPYRQAKP
jgi:hypothetical protein